MSSMTRHEVRKKILALVREHGRNGAAKVIGVGGQKLHEMIQPNAEISEEMLSRVTKVLA